MSNPLTDVLDEGLFPFERSNKFGMIKGAKIENQQLQPLKELQKELQEEEEFDEFIPPSTYEPPPVFVKSKLSDFERTEYPPRHVIGNSTIKLKRGFFENPSIVEMYGESHLAPGHPDTKEIQDEMINFMATRMLELPNSVLFIEGHPDYISTDKVPDGVMPGVGARLKSILRGLPSQKEAVDAYLSKHEGFKRSQFADVNSDLSKQARAEYADDRVKMFDRRHDKDAPGNALYTMTMVDPDAFQIPDDKYMRQISDEIDREIGDLYGEFPGLLDVKKEHTFRPKSAGHIGALLSPLFDAQLLREIQKASKEGKNIITYTGDAHRSNVLKAMGKGFSSIQHGLVFRDYYKYK
jgi:hypothetical protein